jgi:hypothetical protein
MPTTDRLKIYSLMKHRAREFNWAADRQNYTSQKETNRIIW